MRRLLVVSHPAVVPVNQLVYAELQQRGWEIVLVTPKTWRHEFAATPFAAEPLPELAGSFVPIARVLVGRPQRHFYLARPVTDVRRWRPNVVFVEQEAFSLAAFQWGSAAARVGVPFGVQAAENLDRHLPAPVRLMRDFVLRRAAFVAARTPAAANLVVKWGFSGRVEVAPHAVPAWPVPEHHRTGDTFTVGFAGRLTSAKGLDDLVGAVQRLRAPVRLLLVGDGDLRSDLVRTSVVERHDRCAHRRQPRRHGERLCRDGCARAALADDAPVGGAVRTGARGGALVRRPGRRLVVG